jgi:prepilin-type N-terminal cleavage/methylation domain-containing protein
MQTRKKCGMRARRNAFSMVEIMIVVLITGILLNIATPGLLHAREEARAKACIKNLKNIDSAKEQFAMMNGTAQGSYTPLATDLYGTGKYMRSQPSCPTAGLTGYTINPIGTAPSCAIGANLNAAKWDDHIVR